MSQANTPAFPDLDFDALEDLPSFKAPANGHYKLQLTILMKEINKKSAVEFNYVVDEILEQADPTEEPSKQGDKFSVAYFLDNEFSRGRLKQSLLPLKEFTGVSTLAAIAEQCQGLTVYGMVTKKQDKKDAEKFYSDVRNIVVG
jgi:hypothetical protein